jgi:hypothetical protein
MIFALNCDKRVINWDGFCGQQVRGRRATATSAIRFCRVHREEGQCGSASQERISCPIRESIDGEGSHSRLVGCPRASKNPCAGLERGPGTRVQFSCAPHPSRVAQPNRSGLVGTMQLERRPAFTPGLSPRRGRRISRRGIGSPLRDLSERGPNGFSLLGLRAKPRPRNQNSIRVRSSAPRPSKARNAGRKMNGVKIRIGHRR